MQHWLTCMLSASVTALGLVGTYALLTQPGRGTMRLAEGVTLEVARWSALPDSPPGASGGRLLVAHVELDPAMLRLYLTPPDADRSAGSRDDPSAWTHRLRHTATAARHAHAVVMVNGQMFAGERGRLLAGWARRRPGDRGRLTETAVIDGRVLAWWEHAYMLGFGADLRPKPRETKPPPPPGDMADWAVGLSGQSWQLFEGRRGWWEQGLRRNRTAVGVHPEGRRLWLAVGERATLAEMAEALRVRGATHVLHLDGGGSTAMAVNGRAVFGDWRPVLNHFGVILTAAR